MNTKLDHEKYMRDLADTLAQALGKTIHRYSRNCVTCEYFTTNELCDMHKAKPPAIVIVTGCDQYINEIPF